MKICTVISEYNPFHNGHLKHLEHIRNNLKPDFIIVIMSGNFTQRGEIAIINKYDRAKHAVLGGADMVIELPAVFCSQNAEVFAKGALSVLSKLPGEKTLCFGGESDDACALKKLARLTCEESEEYKAVLKQQLSLGNSYITARKNALTMLYSNKDYDFSLLDSPNNVLAIEYVKAIIQNNYDFDINILKRQDNGYSNKVLSKHYSSSLSIRNAILTNSLKKIKKVVPSYTYVDLPKTIENGDSAIIYSLLNASKEKLKNLPDCVEGIENKIKEVILYNFTIKDVVSKLNTKRYTDARFKRILINNLLNIEKSFVLECLSNPLYFRVLAIKKGSERLLTEIANNNTLPIIERKSSISKLENTALKCFYKDVFASNVYNVIKREYNGDFQMKII